MKAIKFSMLFVASLLFLVVAGCQKEQTKNVELAENDYKEIVRILGSLTEPSSIEGLPSADSLLVLAGEEVLLDATWSDSYDFIEQSPSGGETKLRITIAYDGGEIREIIYEPNVGENGMPFFMATCEASLQVDVVITVQTEDGYLNETWDAVLSMDKCENIGLGRRLTLSACFDPSEIVGDFEILSSSVSDPDWVKGFLTHRFIKGVPYLEENGLIQINVQKTRSDFVSLYSQDVLNW